MLIEDLIRLGQPLLSGDMSPEEVLRLVTDVTDERAKNFYRNVFVVVLQGSGAPVVLPRQVYGSETDDGFQVDREKALGAPFVLPSGGNPLNPQGRYGLPVFPLYDPHVQAFRESADGVADFLAGRLERAPVLQLDELARRAVAVAVHERIKTTGLDLRKNLGVLVLARCGDDGFYRLRPKRPDDGRIGETHDGRAIIPDYKRILAAIWEAKIAEGREVGSRAGPCSITGTGQEVVSAYCKAWPWAFPTWTCPLPAGGDVSLMVEGIGLSPDSYRALTLGACVFNQLTKRLSNVVVPELFSPADTRPGREQAQKRKDLPSIYGSAFLLPVRDETLTRENPRYEFVKGVRGMLAYDPEGSTQAERSIATVVGVEQIIPEEFDDDYRLTLVYFSGEYTRGDIHLRAFIQDLVPSKLRLIRDVAQDEALRSIELARTLLPGMTDKYREWLGRRYPSVPYLLARAYGGPYLWAQLETALHGRRLDSLRFTRNAARRLESLVPNWPKSSFAICDEVAFYLNFRRFLGRVNQEETGPPEEQTMRPWKELIHAFEREPVESMKFLSISELGFACGMLIRCFSRWYSGSQGKDKDYLKHRVLTFGADLSPRQVWVRGVKEIPEAAAKYEDLRRAVAAGQLAYYPKDERRKHTGDFSRRLGVVLTELETQGPELEKQRDGFMTGFWAGYCLQGFDRPRTARMPVSTTPARR